MFELLYRFSHQCSNFEEVVNGLCRIALEKFNNLLMHGDVRVIEAVSQASRFIMGSQMTLSDEFQGKLQAIRITLTNIETK